MRAQTKHICINSLISALDCRCDVTSCFSFLPRDGPGIVSQISPFSPKLLFSGCFIIETGNETNSGDEKIVEKDGDDYICEWKNTQNYPCGPLPGAMEDWEGPVQHETEQNRTAKGKMKGYLQFSNLQKGIKVVGVPHMPEKTPFQESSLTGL